jgi:hypothetical protein
MGGVFGYAQIGKTRKSRDSNRKVSNPLIGDLPVAMHYAVDLE